MKRIIFVLSLVLMFANANSAVAATASKAELKAVKNVLKSQIEAANKYSFADFVKFFDLQYVTSDGFNVDVYSKLVEETWAVYPNIQYAQTVKNISITGNDAIAEVLETANAQVQSQYELKGQLKSVANNVYFLRKTPDGWRIVSDVILTEDTYLSFGEMVNHLPTLTAPYQTLANRNYTATLEYNVPKDAIAIASINQEKVSYPQESMKENYRKLPDDGILERFFTANSDSTNEYVVASLGLTRPKFEGKDLQIGITGIAYIIKRVNVVPENKYINATDVTTVSERLKKYSQTTEDELVETKDVKAETVQEQAKTEETPSSQAVDTDAPRAEVINLEEQPKEEVNATVEETVSETKTEAPAVETAPIELSDAEMAKVKQVANTQKALEKEAQQKAKLEEKQLQQELKEKAKAEKIAKQEAVKAEKLEKRLQAQKQKEEAKAEKLAQQEAIKKAKAEKKAEAVRIKAEEKAAKEKLKQEKAAEKLAKKEAKKAYEAEVKAKEEQLKQELKALKADRNNKQKEEKKEKKRTKGAFSPDVVGIPVSATVCPIENLEVANDKK